MQTVAERITKARKDKGWTQKDLAQAMDMNVKNISRYELGHTVPSIEVGAQLADKLGVSLDFLAGLKKEGKDPELEALFKKALELEESEKERLKWVVEKVVG